MFSSLVSSFFSSGVVHRKSGEHQPASQPGHSEHSDQEGLPADRAAGQKRAGREPELQTASSAVETVHVPQQERRQEERGTCDVRALSQFDLSHFPYTYC